MSSKDKLLKQQFGNKDPFKVPEGYFDNLTESVMSHLPAQEAQVIRLHPWWYRYRKAVVAVACGCVALFSVGSYMHFNQQGETSVAKVQSVSSDVAFDELANYFMLDNEDIYASLLNE